MHYEMGDPETAREEVSAARESFACYYPLALKKPWRDVGTS